MTDKKCLTLFALWHAKFKPYTILAMVIEMVCTIFVPPSFFSDTTYPFAVTGAGIFGEDATQTCTGTKSTQPYPTSAVWTALAVCQCLSGLNTRCDCWCIPLPSSAVRATSVTLSRLPPHHLVDKDCVRPLTLLLTQFRIDRFYVWGAGVCSCRFDCLELSTVWHSAHYRQSCFWMPS